MLVARLGKRLSWHYPVENLGFRLRVEDIWLRISVFGRRVEGLGVRVQ